MNVYRGDIWDLLDHAVCIPINQYGVMGAGLARDAYHRFQVECEADMALRRRGARHARFVGIPDPKLDMHQPDLTTGARPWFRPVGLIFFPTKEHWRNDSIPSLIAKSLGDVRSLIDFFNSPARSKDPDAPKRPFKVALPKVGCGLGRLDWEKQVLPLVWQELDRVEEYITLVYPKED